MSEELRHAESDNLEPLPVPVINMPIIQVRDLMKTYHVGEVDVNALNGIDLDVMRGEFLAIVGTSGSGKSTLFNILGGLTPPTSGNRPDQRPGPARDDRQGTDGPAQTHRRFVFQKYNLLPTLTAEQNIQIVRDVAGRSLEFDDQFKHVLDMPGSRSAAPQAEGALGRRAAARGHRACIVNGPQSCWPMSQRAIWTARTPTWC